MPAPSCPRTAGNTPSGSSPDRVKASVWQSAVWVIFTSTSPAFGPSRSSSTICSGWPAWKATAARVFMAWLLQCGCVERSRHGRGPEGNSLQVRADQPGHLGHAGGTLVVAVRGLAELLAQVRLEHLAHQPVDRAADRGDLLQHGRAVGAGFQRAIQRIALAADAPHAGEDLLFLFRRVRHAGTGVDSGGQYTSLDRRGRPSRASLAAFPRSCDRQRSPRMAGARLRRMTRTPLLPAAIFLLAGWLSGAHAQDPSAAAGHAAPDRGALPLDHLPALRGGYFPLVDEASGRSHHVYVRLPEDYEAAPERHWPVVVLLDGDSLFPLLAP